MKLTHRIIVSVSIALIALFALWGLVFYKTSKQGDEGDGDGRYDAVGEFHLCSSL